MPFYRAMLCYAMHSAAYDVWWCPSVHLSCLYGFS